ncbi:MAG TPA: substrate-binding domain-containing protein [Hyphomicrobiaceae bacterium]|nr:substrate-binding domain-containing protein [Hyphomicrobiaceae bacterium]
MKLRRDTRRPAGTPSTIVDVALAADVSIATVSRVIHGHTVGAERKQRVLSAMEALDYRPNTSAQAMRTRSTQTIACAIRGVLMPEMAPFIREAEATLRRAGYTLLLANIEDKVEQQEEMLRFLTGRGIDGLIFTATPDENGRLLDAVRAIGSPTILIDRDGLEAADTVVVDHYSGLTNATEYLLSLGHTRIALLTISASIRPGRERIRAFRAACERAGVGSTALVDDRNLDTTACYHRTSALLSSRHPPTALIAGGMALLPGILHAVASRGLRIGTDISLVAGCDSELAQLMTPGISAVRWDRAEWGRIAATRLLERLETPCLERADIVVPTEFLVRRSCSQPTSG